MYIRKAKNEDIDSIRKLFRETIQVVNSRDYTPEQLACWAEKGSSNEIWQTRIKEQHFIVAEKPTHIVGFCALRPDGYIHSIFVHKDYQREGIARSLLMEIEEYARKNNIKELTADVSLTAKPFFEKNGYKVMYRQTVDIGVTMDNYHMNKILDPDLPLLAFENH